MGNSEAKLDHAPAEPAAPSRDSKTLHSSVSDTNMELNSALSDQSASESAAEEQTDKEDELKTPHEEPKPEKSSPTDSKVLNYKRASPKTGESKCTTIQCTEMWWPSHILLVNN